MYHFSNLLKGIQSEVLPVQWGEVFWDSLTKGKLQERSRQLRYDALFQACHRLDIPLLLTAHTLDDDIVTMFYRLAHLSGIDGMAGMKGATTFPVDGSPVSSRFFVGHPLLPVAKQRLLETCKEAGIEWTEDKSNEDMDYRRNSILNSLRLAQESNPALTTASLERTLNNFKRIRSDIHEDLVKVFDKSVIVNKVNGDCTLILNDAEWIRRRPLATRLIMLLLQYGAANRYPARTPSINALYTSLLQAYEEHQTVQKAWINRLPPSVRPKDLQPIDKTKRVALRQHTLAGCTFYSLSRVDAMRRIALQEKLEGRKMEYGPAFLIQRDPPSKSHVHSAGLSAVEVIIEPGKSFLWDDRIHLSFSHPPSLITEQSTGPRTFRLSFTTPGDIKEFEAFTKNSPAARRRVYAYMGITPGSHLYQIPVVREFTTGPDGEKVCTYMAFPTLKAEYPAGKYQWKTTYAGIPILMSRFLCLP